MSHTKKSILWVEDDKLIASILGKKFAATEFELVHANSGTEALELIKTTTPDIFILDLMLPGVDGFEVLQKIRMDSRFTHAPAIILSNLSKQGDFEKAKTLGATKFMVKASSPLDLIVAEVAKLLA